MDAVQAGHDLGEQGLVGGARAEVPVDGLDQCLLFLEQQVAQGLQPLHALRGVGHRLRQVGGALAGEEGFELVDFLLALLQVGDIGDHGLAPRRSVGGCVAARLSLWRTWFGPMNFAASLDF